MTTNTTLASENLLRAGGFSINDFYDLFDTIISGVFDLLNTPLFGVPLFVIFIAVAVISGIFALLSNKKGGDDN